MPVNRRRAVRERIHRRQRQAKRVAKVVEYEAQQLFANCATLKQAIARAHHSDFSLPIKEAIVVRLQELARIFPHYINRR